MSTHDELLQNYDKKPCEADEGKGWEKKGRNSKKGGGGEERGNEERERERGRVSVCVRERIGREGERE